MHCSIVESRRRLSPYSNHHRVALERLFERVSALAQLPAQIELILNIVANPLSTVEDLREVIQRDISLSVHVLRRANSAFFKQRVKVTDLRTAIGMLGFREVRNLCLTVSVSRMFEPPGNYRAYSREKLWRHCIGTALTARKIARVTGMASADEAYVAGLLHHVGTILLDQHLRTEFCEFINQLDEQLPTHQLERRVFSFDQGQLGEHVVRRWGFSRSIAEAIHYYAYPENYSGDHLCLVHIVALANFLCSRAGWTSLGVQNAEPPPDSTYSMLGLDRHVVSILWEELQATLPEMMSF